tara:strand:- start:4087 stop:4296 length:210 start_codon:yes stop_codon:yes gene_type:complete
MAIPPTKTRHARKVPPLFLIPVLYQPYRSPRLLPVHLLRVFLSLHSDPNAVMVTAATAINHLLNGEMLK